MEYTYDAAIKWLEKIKREKKYFTEDVLMAIHIIAILKTLKKKPKLGEWISVKDRLPEYEEWVLTYAPDGYTVAYLDGDDRWYDLNSLIKGIAYWMPLPEPPKMQPVGNSDKSKEGEDK